MTKKVFIVGVGMTKFVKPNSGRDYPDLGKEAVEAALVDAGIKYDVVQQAVCGYVFGDSTCGQRVLYQVGMTGIPIYNVNNNCATGSTALFLAKQLVEGGVADVILALGFEKVIPGALNDNVYSDRTSPTDKHRNKLAEIAGIDSAPLMAQFFAYVAFEHMRKYGTTEVHIAKIAAKNHRHAVKNPRAQSKREYTVEEVLNSRKIYGPLTKLACCFASDGSAAAVLMSEDAVIRYGLQSKAVEILGMEMVTDTPEIFTDTSFIKMVGYDKIAAAVKKLYAKTGVSPKQVDVVELYDCFAVNEMILYESLQLCGEGQAGKFIDAGDNTYGGQVVVNPSGGVIGKGHPLGATGLAQCAELVWQLRGEAGERQVPRARIALQHIYGAGGGLILSMYRKGFADTVPNNVATIAENSDNFTTYKYMNILEKGMQSDEGNLTQKGRGVCGFKVRNGFGDKPDVTFTISDDDVTELIPGKLNQQKAFFQGRVKIQDNMGLAIKPAVLQQSSAGSIDAIRSKL